VIRKRVIVHGYVQGVGFRYSARAQAGRLGIGGWVRNRGDGTVEAVFAGPAGAVDEVLDACRRGPDGTGVDRVDLREEAAAGLIPSSRPAGFYVMPTV
jgi:acylphosphatase